MASNVIDSSNFKDIVSSITSSTDNKLLLDNICDWNLFEGQILLGFNILKKYEDILKSNLVEINLPSKYYYKPEYVSKDLYDTTDLWYLIMFINDIETVDQFNKSKIKVPNSDIITTLNTIINNESETLRVKDNPRYVKKHMLKNLNEPSIKILSDNYYDDVKRYYRPKFNNKIESLLNYDYFLKTKTINKSYITDKNNKLIEAFEITRGIKAIPSCYYKNGYNNTYMGKVFLESGKKYNFIKTLNGKFNFRIIEDKETVISKNGIKQKVNVPENVLVIDSEYRIKDYDLINDFRSTNLNNNQTVVRTKNNYKDNFDNVLFQNNGRYLLDIDENLNTNTRFNIIEYNISQDEIERINLNRLTGDELYIDCKYSSSYNYDYISLYGYSIVLTYEDNTEDTINQTTEDSFYYCTNNELSDLKISIEKQNKKLTNLKIFFNVKKIKNSNNSKDFDLNFKLESIKILNTTFNDIVCKRDSIITINSEYFTISDNYFVPLKSKWYYFEIDYNYTEDYSGLYFNPKIVEYNTSTKKISIIQNSSIITNYNSDYSISNYKPKLITSSENYIKYSATNTNNINLLKIVSNNLNLPSRFIMTFKFSNINLSNGGLFYFAINTNDNEGYAFILSSSKNNSNSNLPLFVKNGNYNIMPSGFYKLSENIDNDKQFKNYYIFNNDNTEYIRAKCLTQFSSDIENKFKRNKIKIIKKYNNIKVFIQDSNGDFNDPIIDVTDNSNYFLNGGINFNQIFASSDLFIYNYFEYQD